LLSSAPRQPLNINDILKHSLIIILPFLGSVIRWMAHLGSCQALQSWWPLLPALVQIVFDVKFDQLPFSKQKDGKAEG
jgi:hypothetical protein